MPGQLSFEDIWQVRFPLDPTTSLSIEHRTEPPRSAGHIVAPNRLPITRPEHYPFATEAVPVRNKTLDRFASTDSMLKNVAHVSV